MPAATVAQRKRELRASLLAARRALPPPVRQAAAGRLQATIAEVVAAVTEATGTVAEATRPVAGAAGARAGGGATIAGYVPMATEPGGPDLPAVLARALGPGGRLLLPVLREDRDLDWTVYQTAARLDRDAVREAALLVVPAVAVDRRGLRLGRGGGSYDRVLARLAPGTEVVALLYDHELRDEPLPAEPHDRRVTAVVIPGQGLVAIPAAGSGA